MGRMVEWDAGGLVSAPGSVCNYRHPFEQANAYPLPHF